MKATEIKDDLLVNEFFEMMSLKPSTVQNYTNALRAYTEYMNKSPQQLIDEARQDVRDGKQLSERMIKRYLLGFKKHLNDNMLAPTSAKLYMSAVISFYKYFDFEIPKLPRANTKARPLEQNVQIPTHEQLQEILKVLDPLEKAVVLAGCSSGMSSNELIRLTVGQFRQGYDESTGITTIKARRSKSGVDFITFFSPEASHAIWDYLKYRDRPDEKCRGKRKLQLKKQRVTSDNNFLFIRKRIDDKYLETSDEKYRAFDRQGFTVLYQKMSDKAGMSTRYGSWNFIRSHNMRKYYNSALLNAGADSFFVEYTMGHTLDDTRGAYFRASPEKLKEIYAKYVSALTISPLMDLESSEEYKRVMQENSQLAAELGHTTLVTEMNSRKIQALEEGLKLMAKLAQERPDIVMSAFQARE